MTLTTIKIMDFEARSERAESEGEGSKEKMQRLSTDTSFGLKAEARHRAVSGGKGEVKPLECV